MQFSSGSDRCAARPRREVAATSGHLARGQQMFTVSCCVQQDGVWSEQQISYKLPDILLELLQYTVHFLSIKKNAQLYPKYIVTKAILL